MKYSGHDTFHNLINLSLPRWLTNNAFKNLIKRREDVVYTCLWWRRFLRCRCKNLSQSAHRLPHSIHRMMAGVSPSSWLSHVGRGWPWVPFGLLTHSPDVNLSTWSWFNTHSEANDNHNCKIQGGKECYQKNTRYITNTLNTMSTCIIY